MMSADLREVLKRLALGGGGEVMPYFPNQLRLCHAGVQRMRITFLWTFCYPDTFRELKAALWATGGSLEKLPNHYALRLRVQGCKL